MTVDRVGVRGTNGMPATVKRKVLWLSGGIQVEAPVDTRRCTCGGSISVITPFTADRIIAAVDEHRLHDARHRNWAEAGGLWAMLDIEAAEQLEWTA